MQAETFFGWRVVAAVFTLAVFGWGLGFYGPPIVLHAVHEARGWSLPLVSTAITVHFLLGALFVASLARLAARFGMSALTRAGAMSAALGILGWGCAMEPWQLMLASVLTAFGWATMGAAAVNALVTPWFVTKRPAALASAYNGASVAGIVFSPLLVWLIANLGLPAAMAAVGSVTVGVMWWASGRYFARTPAEMGVRPDGGEVAADGPGFEPARQETAPPLRNDTLWQDRRFLLLVTGMSLGLFAQVGMISHLYSLLVPAMGAQGAGFVAGAATVAAISGRTISGWVLNSGGDRALFAAASYGVQIAGIAMFFLADGHNVPLLLLGVMLFGLGIGNAISLPPLIAQASFRAADTARVVPMTVAVSQATYAFSPAAFALLRTEPASGAAPALFVAAMTLKVAAILCLLAIRRTGAGPRPVSD